MVNTPERREGASQNILEVCEEAFSRAYEYSGDETYVIKRGDEEKIRLCTQSPDFEILLTRPPLQTPIHGSVVFGVKRINKDWRKTENPPPLVVAAGDTLHLYMTDHDGDPVRNSPVSDEETARIALLIASGQPGPVDTIESDY